MRIPELPRRNTTSQKGDFGRALIIGGSRGMAGAAGLAGSSALRAGAGLVTIAVPNQCLETVAQFDPNYMTVPIDDDESGKFAASAEQQLVALCRRADSVGIGPGMARSTAVTQVVTALYASFAGPMVVDADALNALAVDDAVSAGGGPRVLTPHIGEFRRLIQKPELTVDQCRAQVSQLAREARAVVVLKGARTLVTDGEQLYENDTGNPGMATGGAGDVLTGVITALIGQQLSLWEAAVLGVYVHGLAGDLARDTFGEVSMVAADIRDHLSAAFQKLNDARH